MKLPEGDLMIVNAEAADYHVPTSTIARGKSSIPHKTPRLSIGHVGMDTYSEAALIAEVLDHALHGNVTRQIVTVNAQIFVLADKSARYRECLYTADYLCADGMPLVWACDRLAGLRVPRIAGVDLIEHLCRQGAADG